MQIEGVCAEHVYFVQGSKFCGECGGKSFVFALGVELCRL